MGEAKLVSFNLVKVTTEQYAEVGAPPSNDENINVTMNIKFGVGGENKSVAAFCRFLFTDSQNHPFLTVEGGCHFKIADNDWEKLIDEEKNSLILPKGFASHLLMITVGTTRGILHSKTENTPFNSFVIPLINVTKIVEKDVEIPLQVITNHAE